MRVSERLVEVGVEEGVRADKVLVELLVVEIFPNTLLDVELQVDRDFGPLGQVVAGDLGHEAPVEFGEEVRKELRQPQELVVGVLQGRPHRQRDHGQAEAAQCRLRLDR
jgi:hypothetical protein